MTLSTRIVRYAFCIFIALLVLHPTCAFAQSTTYDALMKDMQALANFMHSESLNPILDDLRRRAQDDRELLELLNHVKLWTHPTPRVQWGPNAVANYEDGRPIIHVDLIFIKQMFAHADFAGLALVGTSEASAIAEKAGYNYGLSLAQAKQKGLELPDFSFNINEMVTNPVLRLAAEHMAYEAFSSEIAWTILHEVAHHNLGHTRVDPKTPVTLETSRKWELDADRQAFSMMKKLGYHLSPVRIMLGAREATQEIRVLGGAEPPEINSTHPSFATRRKNLEKNHDISKSTPGSYLSIIWFSTDEKGYAYTTTLHVPRPPLSEYLFLATCQESIQNRPLLMPFEWKNGQVHLYGRSPNMLSETIIHDPDHMDPNITIKFTPLPNGPVTEEKTRGFQISLSSIHMADIAPGLKGYQVESASPQTIILQALRTVENRPDILQTAERIWVKTLKETKNIFLRYAQGKLSLEDLQKQTLACPNKGAELLKTLLGPDKYARFSDSMFVNPIMQFGLKRMNTIQSFTQPRRVHIAEGNENTASKPIVPPSETDGRVMLFRQPEPGNMSSSSPRLMPGADDAQLVAEAQKAIQKRDVDRFLSILKEGVNAGYPQCTYYLATYYRIRNNPSKAHPLFLRAALQGHIDSQLELGLAYMEGKETEKDMLKGIFWVGTAAKSGHKRAAEVCRAYNIRHQSDEFGLSPENLRKHGYPWNESGDVKAGPAKDQRQPSVLPEAELSARAKEALKQRDFNRAISLLTQGVEAGYPSCQYDLGMIRYLMQNYSESYNLFLRLALNGHPGAQNMLSTMYAEGKGVSKDLAKANFWKGTSAKSGNEHAIKHCKQNNISYDTADYGLTRQNLVKYGYK